MGKKRKILLALIGAILALTACSNERKADLDMDTGAAQSSSGIQRENKEETSLKDCSSMMTVDIEKSASEKNESENEALLETENIQSENMNGYPSVAEISAAQAEGKGTVYWLASAPTVPEVCKALKAKTADMDTLWDTILDRVFENASMTEKEMPTLYPYHQYVFNWNGRSWSVEIGDVSISLHSDADIDEDILDSILDILSELTGMGVSYETGEINHYAFTYDGLLLDEYGYSPGGDAWVSDSIVSLSDKGIFICNPVVIQNDCETIETQMLLSMDSARTIYETYWIASRRSTVPVITNVELVYYFTDGQLLPAWRLSGQGYDFQQDCYDIVALLDAVSGEIIRST